MPDLDRQRRQKIIRKRRMQVKARAWIKEYLKYHSCVDCGNSDLRVLEFDHRDPSQKKFAISRKVSDGVSIETLVKEVAKCDVRCANCHRIRTKECRHFGRNDKARGTVGGLPKNVEVYHKKLNLLSD